MEATQRGLNVVLSDLRDAAWMDAGLAVKYDKCKYASCCQSPGPGPTSYGLLAKVHEATNSTLRPHILGNGHIWKGVLRRLRCSSAQVLDRISHDAGSPPPEFAGITSPYTPSCAGVWAVPTGIDTNSKSSMRCSCGCADARSASGRWNRRRCKCS